MDDLQLSDLEIPNIKQKQWLKRDDRQTQSSSSFQTGEDVLKQFGLSHALIRSTMQSMEGKFNHQCSIYFVQESIEEVVQSSPQASSLSILKLCFEEGTAEKLQKYLTKNSLLKHQGLQYWMSLYIEYINDQVNDKQKMENNATNQGEWYLSNTGNTRIQPWKINCIRLGFKDVDSFVKADTTLQSIVESENKWFHGTTDRHAEIIKKNGIMLQRGNKHMDFSHNHGFYLSPNLMDAKDWAEQKSGIVSSTKGAVLIYSFSKNDFHGVVPNARNEWQSIVRYYRSGMICSIPKDLKNRLEYTDYIFGKIALLDNIPAQDADIEDWESWTPTTFHGKYQLCISKDTMAQKITPKLIRIIYLTR